LKEREDKKEALSGFCSIFVYLPEWLGLKTGARLSGTRVKLMKEVR